MTTETANRLQRAEPAAQSLRNTNVPTLVFQNSDDLARHVATLVEDLIRDNDAEGRPTVLGLPTGSTPIGVYRELIRRHNEEGLDFSNVVTFNLDEYWPMDPGSIHSYNRWMQETFFDHVNIPEENIHIPKGTLALEEVEPFCNEYEKKIEQAGGVQLQLLGIGRTGHMGFNEPGSSRHSRTRMVSLDPVTRKDAASGFFGEENVPFKAITMGVGTILGADQVVIMALGEHKVPIVRTAIEDEVTADVSSSFLQEHPNAVFAVDEAAGAELTDVKYPWLGGPVDWTPQMEKRAVIWLSQQAKKPLLKLEERDFLDHHLHDLLREFRESGSAPAIRQRVYDALQDGICTKPGGDAKTVLVFSPHPDDDVISMGGTLITLADQGHDVHIAYMTSGNIAVFDHDAARHIDYVREFCELFKLDSDDSRELIHQLNRDIGQKEPGDPDSKRLLAVKALIRKTEATVVAQVAGVPADNLHFLDLPFYRTGDITKRPIGEDDVQLVTDLLSSVRPDQVYFAGDLSDPHGTHRVCAQAIIQALERLEADELRPEVWLYRGAWQEYEPHEIERAVPLSPEVSLRKRSAIFKHESQKDRALFPGNDAREFWVRAEQRTQNTARVYNQLGLPEYHALEGFVRFSGQQL